MLCSLRPERTLFTIVETMQSIERSITMIDASQVKENMEVKGSDGKHVGTVDHVEGNRVRLASGGMLHDIDLALVDKIRDGAVCLTQSAEEVTRAWH